MARTSIETIKQLTLDPRLLEEAARVTPAEWLRQRRETRRFADVRKVGFPDGLAHQAARQDSRGSVLTFDKDITADLTLIIPTN